MKITLNTDYSTVTASSPNIAAASLQAGTGWTFKREQTPILQIYFTGTDKAADATAVVFGMKRPGTYDGALVFKAEGNLQQDAEGVDYWEIRPTFSSPVFDADLGVGSAAVDIANAAYIGEIQYTRADGTTAATVTPNISIANNVVRDASVIDLPTLYAWTSLTLVQMRWADYCALTEKDPDALYVIPDAPSEVDEHNAAEDAHAELFAALKAELVEKINTCATTDALAEILAGYVTSPRLGEVLLDYVLKTQVATINAAGLVKLSYGEPLDYTNSGEIGLGPSGGLRAHIAASNRLGVVKVGGKGVGLNDANQLALNIRASHSGLDFDGTGAYINVAKQNVHPTAGTVAPVATDTAGKLVVLNATTTLPGGVRLATGVDDTGDVAVLTAAQVKTAIEALEARLAALEAMEA